MVTVKLYGRLGNQLFQIAACMAHALRNNTDYAIPNKTINPAEWPAYFSFPEMVETRDYTSMTWTETSHSFQRIPFVNNMCLNGYFQSEKYFKDYKQEIITKVGLHYNWIQNTVAVHVRRGDFLQYPDKHPVLSMDYYKKAINFFVKKGYQFFCFFSDDISFCQHNFVPDKNISYRFCDYESPLMDLKQMAYFEHNIIANSSFSWWGAWLNQNPDKIVIAPKVWFGPGNAHLDTKDLLPDEWIKM